MTKNDCNDARHLHLDSKIMILTLFYLLINSINGNELSIRQKRQYYICGEYPNRFYSLLPCSAHTTRRYYNPSGNQCQNGGLKLGVGCYFDYHCTPYTTGRAVCLSNCCCTVPSLPTTVRPQSTTPPLSTLAYCYNGQRTQVRCTVSTDCAPRQTCINSVCCTTTGDEWTGACGGIAALMPCNTQSSQQCGSFTCTSSNYCCECQYGRTSGLCSNGCGEGFTCSANGYCCAQCPSGRAPFGSCFNGQCASGYQCMPGCKPNETVK